jgi:hypothetical protein
MASSSKSHAQSKLKTVKEEKILDIEIPSKVNIRGPLLGRVPNLKYVD